MKTTRTIIFFSLINLMFFSFASLSQADSQEDYYNQFPPNIYTSILPAHENQEGYYNVYIPILPADDLNINQRTAPNENQEGYYNVYIFRLPVTLHEGGVFRPHPRA